MIQSVRVRFAPSPTGSLHLGGIRSALFDWLWAKKNQGVFILRIEDTDRERLVEGALKQIQESLQWLGLDWDEGPNKGGEFGPYVQSERLGIYKKYALIGVEKGFLYPCWCSPERLDTLRKDAQKAKVAFKYDRHCLANPGDSKDPHVLRFKVPESQTLAWEDSVKGKIEFSSNDVDDFVTIKSDGFPTYHFASIVDDHLMQISHVLRGDEWVASTPKHLLLYKAYGWEAPEFVHLPQVLGTDKAKLSKRHGAKSVLEYREEGYLPEAVVNFMALLGWNPGGGSTQEIFTTEGLIDAFSITGINSSPAVFDPARLDWMNGEYIRALPIEELLERCRDFWPQEAKGAKEDYKKQVLALVHERLKFLGELSGLTEFFFSDPEVDLDLLAPSGEAKVLLEEVITKLSQSDFTLDDLEKRLRALAESLGIKAGELFGVIRTSITGRTAAPGLFETLETLGKETSLRRIQAVADGL